MTSYIKIKRSGTAGNPSVLGAGELAYSYLADNGANGGDRLYIGTGAETSGNAVNHTVIGGKYFTDLVSAATNLNTASTIVKRDATGNFIVSSASFAGATSGNASIVAPAIAGATTITLPGVTSTLATLAGIETLFNKTFVTPALGAATATTVNKITLTQPATGATLTIADGITVTHSGFSQTFTATAATSVTLPISGTLATLTGTETLTNKTFTTPNIGAATATSVTGVSGLTLNSGGANTNINLVPTGIGTVDVGNFRITSVGTPTSGTDAATKAYVDATKSGLDIKDSVRVATTANLTATASGAGVGKTLTNSGTQTVLAIDGVTLVFGDRVLVKNQTTGADNGIYTVTNIGSASTNWVLTRATDADNTPTGEVTSGMFAYVEAGTANATNAFVLTTTSAITLDTTGLVFTQFSGAGQVIDGLGLIKIGNQLDVQVGTGIAIVSDTVTLASTVAGAGLTFTTGVLDVVGTTNRIIVNADSLDISPNYIGQTSITTLGTITAGTWNSTTIGTSYGGTGLATYATGDILYASATNTLSKLAAGTDGYYLQMSGGVPVWAALDGGTY